MAGRRPSSSPPPIPASRLPGKVRGGGIPSVVVLAGAEAWFREAASKLLVRTLLPDGDPGGALVRLDAKRPEDATAIAGLLDELRSSSLFASTKVVHLRAAEAAKAPPGSGRTQAVTAWANAHLQDPRPGAYLILETTRGTKGRSSVATDKLMAAGAWVVDCRALYDAPGPWERGTPPWDHELARHLVTRMKQTRGKHLRLEDAHAMSLRVGNDLAALEGAIESLALHAGDAAEIQSDAIDNVLGSTREDPVWKLSDLIFDGKTKESLDMVDAIFDRGIHDERGAHTNRAEALAPRLIATLSGAWRKILVGAEALQRGDPPGSAARAAGLPPFLAEGFAARCRLRPPRAFLRLAGAFLEAERGIKGGGVPPRLAVERLVRRLLGVG